MPTHFNTRYDDNSVDRDEGRTRVVRNEYKGAATVLGTATTTASKSGSRGGKNSASSKNNSQRRTAKPKKTRAYEQDDNNNNYEGTADEADDDNSPVLTPSKRRTVVAARPGHTPRNRAGLTVPANGLYRAASFAAAVAIGIWGGLLTRSALDYRGEFVWVAFALTGFLAYRELIFWIHFHDKSFLDLLKMAFTGELGFAGYLTIVAVGFSIAFNATGLHKADEFSQWSAGDWHTWWDCFEGASISVTPGALLHYAFTGKFWGS